MAIRFPFETGKKNDKCLAAYESRQITNYNVELFIHRKMYVTSHMQVITLWNASNNNSIRKIIIWIKFFVIKVHAHAHNKWIKKKLKKKIPLAVRIVAFTKNNKRNEIKKNWGLLSIKRLENELKSMSCNMDGWCAFDSTR